MCNWVWLKRKECEECGKRCESIEGKIIERESKEKT